MTRKEVNGWMRVLTNSAKGGLGAQSEARDRKMVVSLPPLKSVYGDKPVTYQAGCLYVGDECVRERKS